MATSAEETVAVITEGLIREMRRALEEHGELPDDWCRCLALLTEEMGEAAARKKQFEQQAAIKLHRHHLVVLHPS